MLEAEAIMHGQISRDLDCSFVAEEVLKMRAVMSLLVAERTRLGDHEPILVNSFFSPRPPPVQRLVAAVRWSDTSCPPKTVAESLISAKWRKEADAALG
jgi:hypothetical protein